MSVSYRKSPPLKTSVKVTPPFRTDQPSDIVTAHPPQYSRKIQHYIKGRANSSLIAI